MTKDGSDTTVAVADAVAHLTIDVKKAVEGLQGGIHRSYHAGPSVEFSEHNRYYPGDDPSTIDWKAVARTDEYFIKAHEKEAQLSCLMLLDSSGSMSYTGSKTEYSKLQYAKILLGTIGHLLIKQGDSAGLLAFDKSVHSYLPPNNAPSHQSRLIDSLGKIEAVKDGHTDFLKALNNASKIVGKRGMIIIVSDLWGADKQTENWLIKMAKKNHDVTVFRVLCPDEINFPFDGEVNFEGLEKEGNITVKPARIRSSYFEHLEKEFDRWNLIAAKSGITIINCETSTLPAVTVAKFARMQHQNRLRR